MTRKKVQNEQCGSFSFFDSIAAKNIENILFLE